ncbi:MAG: skp-like protein [Chlamydiales bacterium]|jgi:outer membrane protein|nr:skp-like protein [Chlamydiales bacterium]
MATLAHLSRWMNRSLKSLAFASVFVLGFEGSLEGAEETAAAPSSSPAVSMSSSLKVGIVNFKNCLEISKMGKDEQRRFEDMKKEIDKSLQEREKSLNDISSKFNDEYLDSISEEAEADLKEQFRKLSQEFTFAQNQYYQLLQQTNIRMLQSISEILSQASKEVAERENIDMVFSEDSCFFYKPALDITKAVVEVMDGIYEKSQKQEATTSAPDEAKNKEA